MHTGSDHPLDADPGGVDLLGELVDGLRGVLISIRVHIGLYSRERDCGDREEGTESVLGCVFNILTRLKGKI